MWRCAQELFNVLWSSQISKGIFKQLSRHGNFNCTIKGSWQDHYTPVVFKYEDGKKNCPSYSFCMPTYFTCDFLTYAGIEIDIFDILCSHPMKSMGAISSFVTNALCDLSRCSVVPDAHPDQKETQTIFQTSAGWARRWIYAQWVHHQAAAEGAIGPPEPQRPTS